MQSILPMLRLIIGPAAVAAFAVLQLRPFGRLAEATGGFGVFLLSIVAMSAWRSLQFRRARRRIRLLRQRRPEGPR